MKKFYNLGPMTNILGPKLLTKVLPSMLRVNKIFLIEAVLMHSHNIRLNEKAKGNFSKESFLQLIGLLLLITSPSIRKSLSRKIIWLSALISVVFHTVASVLKKSSLK